MLTFQILDFSSFGDGLFPIQSFHFHVKSVFFVLVFYLLSILVLFFNTKIKHYNASLGREFSRVKCIQTLSIGSKEKAQAGWLIGHIFSCY